MTKKTKIIQNKTQNKEKGIKNYYLNGMLYFRS